MSDNIFDFANKKIDKKQSDQTQEKNKKNLVDEKIINDYVNKYKDYNQEQLVDEFLKVTNESRKSGALDNNKINDVVNKLTPFLTDEQKKGLDNLLKRLDD